MGLFSALAGLTGNSKSLSEMSDRELIRFIENPPFGTSIAGSVKAIEEAISRGLTNPKTGKPYHR